MDEPVEVVYPANNRNTLRINRQNYGLFSFTSPSPPFSNNRFTSRVFYQANIEKLRMTRIASITIIVLRNIDSLPCIVSDTLFCYVWFNLTWHEVIGMEFYGLLFMGNVGINFEIWVVLINDEMMFLFRRFLSFFVIIQNFEH